MDLISTHGGYVYRLLSFYPQGGRAWPGGVCMAGVCVLGGKGVGETATEVASTHPTGMRFCLYGDQNDAQLKVRFENILYSKIS